jgi:N4-gp56 family major capsid protein
MPTTPIQFNTGYTTSDMGPQITQYDMQRIAVQEAKKNIRFSQMGMLQKIKPNHGDELKRYREYPILHDSNVNNQGLDAQGAELLANKWYAYKADGSRTVHIDEASARAVLGVVKVLKGGGALYAGSRDFALQNDNFPLIGEIGGRGNRVGLTREILTAKVKKYAINIEYTADALKFDSQPKLNIKYAREIGRAYSELREAIVRNQLITEGLVNAAYGGSATTVIEVDETSGITYPSLRRMQTSLDLARCPYDTKVISGSKNIDTVTVSASRYVYIPIELESEIEDLTHNGRAMYSDWASYAAAGGTSYAQGEIGKAGKFRFISDFDFPIMKGAGADATNGLDANANGIEDAGEGKSITNGHYDVAPLLFVGSESFEVITTEKDGFVLNESAPKVTPGVDNYADLGVVSVKWHQGLMVNKAEHIRCLLVSFNK